MTPGSTLKSSNPATLADGTSRKPPEGRSRGSSYDSHVEPVLFLPIIDWEFRTQRPQHLASCFARSGHRVYYASLRLNAAPEPPRAVASGLWRVDLAGDPAPSLTAITSPPRPSMRVVARLVEESARHPLDGCWVVAQLPFWRPLAERLRERFNGLVLYDCIDDLAEFSDHGDLRQEELALAQSADLVSVTADRLARRVGPTAGGWSWYATVAIRNISASPPWSARTARVWSSVFSAEFTSG